MKYNGLRKPKTHQERRMNDDPEIREYVRPKRKPKNIPTDWDDIQKTTSKKPKYKHKRRDRFTDFEDMDA